MIEILTVSGAQIEPFLADAARLRIEVFREFPYLYEGSLDYEREYLRSYAKSARSVFVLAIRDARVIGISTGLPLEEADESFRKPFVEAGIDPAEIFYLGESVLTRSERGQGIGHRFFDERERHAATLGFTKTVFCAVERPTNHPKRPTDYRSNDPFWTKRGYTKNPDLRAELDWQQVDEPQGQESRNQLIFWEKSQK